MEEQKYFYNSIIVKLVCVIIFLIIIIIAIPKKPETIETIKEVEKEVIVEVQKEPTYTYNITSTEREMLARLVYREANTESLECQMAAYKDSRTINSLVNKILSEYINDTKK